MKYTKLGPSDLTVSRVCMGCMGFAWQLAKANALAEREGWAKFISVQGHYNLIFREEEREMVPYCQEEGIALTPYSALAAGRLSRKPGETSQRLEKDAYAKFKYDA